jgi:hypothetical protein
VQAGVTATVLDQQFQPVAGQTVDFTASGTGGESPSSASPLTDASGVASFSFTSTAPGTSTIQASATRPPPAGGNVTASVTANWAGPPASISLNVVNQNATAPVGGKATLASVVKDSGGRFVGDNTRVSFTVTGAGAQSGSAATSGGNALFSFTSNVTGTSTITASAGAAQSNSVTVTWQAPVPTGVRLSPKQSAKIIGGTQIFVAEVLDQFGGDIAGARVRFAIQGANGQPTTFSAVTDSTGKVAFQDRGVNLGIDTIVAFVDLQNSGLLDPGDPYDTASIIWLQKPGQGYWLVATDGGIFAFGPSANFEGSTGAIHLNQPIVGMAGSPTGFGYLLVASDGGIFAFGDSIFKGSTGSLHLNKPIVGMARTPDGGGYWLVASDGGIFAFGNAAFKGSTGSLHLNKPIVGMAATPDGGGYWLVASDGGIFAFGNAAFKGSTGAIKLNKPIVGMAATPTGAGYWLAATDGGIFAFGDATFKGSTGGTTLNKPIVGIGAMPDGSGYTMAASDGGVFNFGGAPAFGSAAGGPLNQPIVGIAIAP